MSFFGLPLGVRVRVDDREKEKFSSEIYKGVIAGDDVSILILSISFRIIRNRKEKIRKIKRKKKSKAIYRENSEISKGISL